jgi:tryptophan synthase beta chain
MQTLGLFGDFGGLYVPETLIPALEALEAGFLACQQDTAFMAEFHDLLANYAGRPTPLYFAANTSAHVGLNVWFKREDLLHGGAHKTNNALGQALLAKKLGKTRLIAETGAGQHGVATAMAGALLGLETVVYMGALDVARQSPNVARMQMMGTTVVAVETGGKTLKDAINDALRDWITNVNDTHYVLGTVAGPHPFPTMVKFFHQAIGQECRQQCLTQIGHLPDAVVACVGGGSNAIGIFSGFMDDANVKLIGVEPAGKGLDTDEHGAVLAKGVPGTLHGMRSYVLQTPDGQVQNTHSISAGLDYPSVGPEHAYLQQIGRATYGSVTDDAAVQACFDCARREGIIPALETAHALAYLPTLAKQLPSGASVVVNLSGRGDKDLPQLMALRPQVAG